MTESHTGEHENPAESVEVINESFDAADAWNVPVNVRLNEEFEPGNMVKTGFFFLGADNYTPRKDRLEPEHFGVRSQDPELLRRIVAEKVVPLYEGALEQVQGIANGTNNSMQEWVPEQLPDSR